jgi:hypothetical protein
MTRRVWNPEKSKLLEETINDILDKIKRHEIDVSIRPKTLVELDGDYKSLYFSAFTRKNRPDWAKKMFPSTQEDPSGFGSFVGYLNGRLENDTLVNGKQPMKEFVSHTYLELDEIYGMREDYLEGKIDRDNAIRILKERFEIKLSPGQEYLYFGENQLSRFKIQPVLSKIREQIKEINIDLSNADFLKGLLFESMIGTYLTAIYRRDTVSSQVGLPIRYRDFDGKRHSKVFLDFLVEGTIHEVKWRNDFENIIESVLPQVTGYERQNDIETSATVICREKSPDLEIMLQDDIYLGEEATLLGLDESARRISKLIKYISFEEMISGEPNEELFRDALQIVDNVINEGDNVKIKSL